jgi:CRISPR system Cascade subunit CasC
MDRFVQLHFLSSYPAALLNRDDAGFAKRITFGGAVRTRISSQCLKRHWRLFDGEHGLCKLNLPSSVRSRRTFDEFILKPLLSDGVAPDVAFKVTKALAEALLGKSAKADKKTADEDGDAVAAAKGGEEAGVRTGQVTVFGQPEIEYLLRLARDLSRGAGQGPVVSAVLAAAELQGEDGKAKKSKKGAKNKDPLAEQVTARLKAEARNLQALRAAAGLDAAMFGRMVTSDLLARGDAAVHVAHAFTVHEEESEADYFTAVDDLRQQEEELGSGHLGSTELTSGLFYGYVVIDLPLLVSNLEGVDRKTWTSADRQTAAEVVKRLLWTIATASPGAKLGSTAPYAYAQLLLAEVGNAQPRTLANAFLRPVPLRPDPLGNALAALGDHVAALDVMYGPPPPEGRRMAVLTLTETLLARCGMARRSTVPELADWLAARVRGQQ